MAVLLSNSPAGIAVISVLQNISRASSINTLVLNKSAGMAVSPVPVKHCWRVVTRVLLSNKPTGTVVMAAQFLKVVKKSVTAVLASNNPLGWYPNWLD